MRYTLPVFLSSFTRSSDHRVHLSCIENFSNNARNSLKGTIFSDKITFTYCVLICHALGGHKRLSNSTGMENLVDMCIHWVSLVKSYGLVP